MHPREALQWYLDAGVDEAIESTPQNRFAAPPPPPAPVTEMPKKAAAISLAPQIPSAAMADARRLADAATTREELEAAVRGFDGCGLKKTAMKTVFCDGNPNARVMVIGEAPGAQEDEQGIPFCGPSGKLLDAMFASINLKRADNLYISNTVFWRPPGNRAPSKEELAICEPFVQKHIALMKPTLLVLAGGVATAAVLKNELSLSRLRGKFYDYTNTYLTAPIKTAIVFHPSYLLRSPSQKRLAWADMQMLQDFLKAHGAA